MEGRTAIIGDGESITVFRAAGCAAYPAEDAKKARETLRRIAKDYSVIFMTEELYKQNAGYLRRFDEEPYPVILCIPSKNGSTGYGDDMLRDITVKALGVDILFHGE